MFIVWGSKGFRSEIGDSRVVRECENCHNEVRFKLCQVGKKFTLFWVPLFTVQKKYYLYCPICNMAHEMSANDIENLTYKPKEIDQD